VPGESVRRIEVYFRQDQAADGIASDQEGVLQGQTRLRKIEISNLYVQDWTGITFQLNNLLSSD
jgi:hypothetical protein